MVTSRWRRWIVSIGLAITALPLLALLVLYLLKPAGTRLVVAMLLHPLVANTRPPAMFAHQLTAARVIDRAETSRQLTARLQHEIPIGTTEATLEAALLAQGFKPKDPPQDCVPVQNGQPLRTDHPMAACPPPDHRKSLTYEWGSRVCGETVWVRWSTDASEVVTLLDGYYDIACRR